MYPDDRTPRKNLLQVDDVLEISDEDDSFGISWDEDEQIDYYNRIYNNGPEMDIFSMFGGSFEEPLSEYGSMSGSDDSTATTVEYWSDEADFRSPKKRTRKEAGLKNTDDRPTKKPFRFE